MQAKAKVPHLKPYKRLQIKDKLRSRRMTSREGALRLVRVSIWVLFALTLAACVDEPAPIVEEQPLLTRTAVPHPTAPPPTQMIEEATVEATAVATATTAPFPGTPEPKELIVCFSYSSQNLFLYSDYSPFSREVQQGLYENLYTTLDYGYQPRGLVKLPNLADGDARWQTVIVEAGDQVVNNEGVSVSLADGVIIQDSNGQWVSFDGDPVEMRQLVVDFELHPMFWSDGERVTAQDSLFSFAVASSPLAASDKQRIAFTESYKQTGQLTLQWAGLPGYWDETYFLNVWQPLPSHLLGELTVEQIFELPHDDPKLLVGNGPFMFDFFEWGDAVFLKRNPYYYATESGGVPLDSVRFRQSPDINNQTAQLLVGQCNIMHSHQFLGHMSITPFLFEADRMREEVQAHLTIAQSASFYDAIMAVDIDWRETGAFHCIDLARIDKIMGNGVARERGVMETAVYPYTYDIEAGNQWLTNRELIDRNQDGFRESQGGVTSTVTLWVSTAVPEEAIAVFEEGMSACGIKTLVRQFGDELHQPMNVDDTDWIKDVGAVANFLIFPPLKVSPIQDRVLNFQPNITQSADLWNLYELDIVPAVDDE